MKSSTLILVGVLMCFRAGAQDDAIGKYFGKYLDDNRFTLVSVSPKMFQLISKVKWDSAGGRVKAAVNKLQSLRILTTGSTPDAFYKEAAATIDMKQYEELLTVRSKDEDTKFLIREENGVIRELLMISRSQNEFDLLSITGDIDLDEIGKISGDFSVQGFDKLGEAARKRHAMHVNH